MRASIKPVLQFYTKWENLGLRVTFILVSLQVIHLFWLTTFVILDAPELTLYIPPVLFVIIDYIEIPALISGTTFYAILIFNRECRGKNIFFLGLLLIQVVHLVWITDAFIYMSFKFNEMTYLAWIAVFVDFLEVLVAYDLYKRIRNR